MATPLHILCFGASLTAGYTNLGTLYHPYANALKSVLDAAFPSLAVSIDVQGLSGDQVISPPGGFLPRMDILYEEVHAQTPYDFAIILGGTNDLCRKSLPNEIYQAFQKVWSIPLSQATKVLALTIPEIGYCSVTLAKRREKLNTLILNHQEENFYTYDLASAMPYSGLQEDERTEIWDDDVHFTPKGYDLMGRLVAERMLELMPAVGIEEPNKKKGEQEVKKLD